VWWDIQLSLNYVFTAKFGSERNLKVTGKKVDCLVCPVCLAMFCLKMKNWPDNLPMMNKNYYYADYF